MKNTSDRVLDLVEEFYQEFDKVDYEISNLLRKAIRIARFVKEYQAFATLSLCMIDFTNNRERENIWAEIVPHINEEVYELIKKEVREDIIVLKEIHDGKVSTFSTPNIISQIKDLNEFKNTYGNDIPTEIAQILHNYKNVIQRLKDYSYSFVSRIEQNAIENSFNFLDKNKIFVFENIENIAKGASEILKVSEIALNSDSKEQLSFACLGCRRVLKKIADELYPAQSKKLLKNGKKIDLSEDKYINRLWQFIDENFTLNTSKQLLEKDFMQLGEKIEKIYELQNKGVHSTITQIEVEQVMARTYLLIGDLIRIKQGNTSSDLSNDLDELPI